jgi:predicted RNase H-like HicB family nuclease
MRYYIALIYKEPRSDYGVSFPDLPGCVTAGATLDEARAMAEEALALHLEGFEADGETPPAPSSLEAIMAEAVNRDAVAALIPAPLHPARAVRVNITLPESALEAIDVCAERKGLTRSGFLLTAARRVMAEEADAPDEAAPR